MDACWGVLHEVPGVAEALWVEGWGGVRDGGFFETAGV